MEKSTLINRLRELTQTYSMFADIMAIKQSEYAILMQTFGISWDELKQPSNTFSVCYEMVLTENDLRKELNWYLDTLKRTKEKGLIDKEQEVKFMLQGFLNGVRFFNPKLSGEFSLLAYKINS